MSELRAQCKESHKHIRSGAYAEKIATGTLSLLEYKQLLLANYWFHTYIERSINQYLRDSWKAELALEHRVKSIYALEDLLSFGFARPKKPKFPFNPVTCELGALGALYVAEGTAIGGAIIKKSLLKIPSIAEAGSILFYGCYGSQLSALWKQFEHFMRQTSVSLAEAEVASNTALKMFDLYEGLLETATHSRLETYQDVESNVA